MAVIVRAHSYSDGAVARPDHANVNETTLYNEINGNLDWDNIKAALQNAANGLVKLDGDAKVPAAQMAAIIASAISIADAGDRYTATEVEAALQEIAGADRTTETVKANATAIIVNIANIAANIANIATNAGDIVTNAGNIPSSNAVVKAWIQFNGTGTIAIQDSFNVSSIVDNGVGDYTINWDTDFANANYAVVVGVGRGAGSPTGHNIVEIAAGSVRIQTFLPSTSEARDANFVCLMAIGAQ